VAFHLHAWFVAISSAAVEHGSSSRLRDRGQTGKDSVCNEGSHLQERQPEGLQTATGVDTKQI